MAVLAYLAHSCGVQATGMVTALSLYLRVFVSHSAFIQLAACCIGPSPSSWLTRLDYVPACCHGYPDNVPILCICVSNWNISGQKCGDGFTLRIRAGSCMYTSTYIPTVLWGVI
ncbi:hypothetical protein M404DRAFT_701710 [Pisolithus tinctorius Marx 270]|uniref:Uncharacterized protein n=1 Tax=Pisolithus tinctorius Marx 270 TaxID=870435 RepID=A0A0C3PUK1_PISTI|nr:hypothetical protein M404DRAFT_701710 [Pisolithus tinctorius Marx 270]